MHFPLVNMQSRVLWKDGGLESHLEMGPVGMQELFNHAATYVWD